LLVLRKIRSSRVTANQLFLSLYKLFGQQNLRQIIPLEKTNFNKLSRSCRHCLTAVNPSCPGFQVVIILATPFANWRPSIAKSRVFLEEFDPFRQLSLAGGGGWGKAFGLLALLAIGFPLPKK
jgi:hypothetical protein